MTKEEHIRKHILVEKSLESIETYKEKNNCFDVKCLYVILPYHYSIT